MEENIVFLGRYNVFFLFCAFCYFQTSPLGVSHTPSDKPTAKFETSEKFFRSLSLDSKNVKLKFLFV